MGIQVPNLEELMRAGLEVSEVRLSRQSVRAMRRFEYLPVRREGNHDVVPVVWLNRRSFPHGRLHSALKCPRVEEWWSRGQEPGYLLVSRLRFSSSLASSSRVSPEQEREKSAMSADFCLLYWWSFNLMCVCVVLGLYICATWGKTCMLCIRMTLGRGNRCQFLICVCVFVFMFVHVYQCAYLAY